MKQSEARALIKSKITVDSNGCWIYPSKGRRYGSVMRQGKRYCTHRLSYMAFCGPIGDKEVCHSCDVSLCVNPDHLFLGTRDDNMADMASKDRGGARAHRNQRSKLTDDHVRDIRAKFERGIPISWLASEYGTSKTYMRDICRRRIKGGYETRYHADVST